MEQQTSVATVTTADDLGRASELSVELSDVAKQVYDAWCESDLDCYEINDRDDAWLACSSARDMAERLDAIQRRLNEIADELETISNGDDDAGAE